MLSRNNDDFDEFDRMFFFLFRIVLATIFVWFAIAFITMCVKAYVGYKVYTSPTVQELLEGDPLNLRDDQNQSEQ